MRPTDYTGWAVGFMMGPMFRDWAFGSRVVGPTVVATLTCSMMAGATHRSCILT